MKKIMITGKNSFVGVNLLNWLRKSPNPYFVETISLKSDSWYKKSFIGFDVIIHTAGIAHIRETKGNSELYYKVNRNLAYDVAKKAKAEGVKQFIFLSSMSVYGIDSGIINSSSHIKPKSHYGKSKLEAEILISGLEDGDFKVAIIRPPMIYGKACKGNYPKLSKLATKTFIFPSLDNKRSMIYIDNLSIFLNAIIENNDRGVYHPQNRDFINTSEMVKLISLIHGKRIIFTKLFNPLIKILRINMTINKIFGDLFYDKQLSEYYKIESSYIDFVDSVKLTED